MGPTLHVEEFLFQAKAIRVYVEPSGEPLPIFHTIRVTVHRPNWLSVDVNGDDGSTKPAFDGKTAIVYSAAANKYASIPVPQGTLEAMMKEAVGRPGVNFPLAQFSDWNFNIHPADAELAFQPPAGAEQVALKPAAAPAPAKKGGK